MFVENKRRKKKDLEGRKSQLKEPLLMVTIPPSNNEGNNNNTNNSWQWEQSSPDVNIFVIMEFGKYSIINFKQWTSSRNKPIECISIILGLVAC